MKYKQSVSFPYQKKLGVEERSIATKVYAEPVPSHETSKERLGVLVVTGENCASNVPPLRLSFVPANITIHL